MGKSVFELLDEWMPGDDPSKWAKLSDEVGMHTLELLLLKEILLELRIMNDMMGVRRSMRGLDENSYEGIDDPYEEIFEVPGVNIQDMELDD